MFYPETLDWARGDICVRPAVWDETWHWLTLKNLKAADTWGLGSTSERFNTSRPLRLTGEFTRNSLAWGISKVMKGLGKSTERKDSGLKGLKRRPSEYIWGFFGLSFSPSFLHSFMDFLCRFEFIELGVILCMNYAKQLLFLFPLLDTQLPEWAFVTVVRSQISHHTFTSTHQRIPFTLGIKCKLPATAREAVRTPAPGHLFKIFLWLARTFQL